MNLELYWHKSPFLLRRLVMTISFIVLRLKCRATVYPKGSFPEHSDKTSPSAKHIPTSAQLSGKRAESSPIPALTLVLPGAFKTSVSVYVLLKPNRSGFCVVRHPLDCLQELYSGPWPWGICGSSSLSFPYLKLCLGRGGKRKSSANTGPEKGFVVR